MSNNHKKHSYYNIIIGDMEFYAAEVFSKKIRLLSINIDLERIEDRLDKSIDETTVKTYLEKKSKDVLFLKTILSKNKNILATASAIWSKESEYDEND